MKNVTITLDDQVARWVRVLAARQETSVSRFVGELLREHMSRDEAYEAAMEQYLARPPAVLKRAGRYPSREALHDR
jgi:predicted transcriptional regulator